MLDVGLAVEERQRVLGQREVQRCLWHTGAIGHLVDPQEVTREQRFLQRRRGNLIVLADEQEQEINQHQGIDNGVHPTHDGAHGAFLHALPRAPRQVLSQVDVAKQQQAKQQPGVAHPDGPQHIDQCHSAEAQPAGHLHTTQALLERTGLAHILFLLDFIYPLFGLIDVASHDCLVD